MMQGQEITFLGGINTDDDVRFITDGDYRSSKYARTGSAEDQNMGALESMPGNILIDNANYPDGVNTVIGSAKWIENNSIIYFVFNDQNNHSIWTYKLDTKEINKVISNLTTDIETYAGEALNFKVENKIYHANVIDNILYWTDGINPPRKLDINKAIKFIETQGLDEEGYSPLAFNSVEEASKTMDVLKAPPTVVIDAEYQTNTNKNFNKLYGNQYQFRYQYVYENNEESKWSMISKQPFPTVSEFVAGRNTIDALADNEIKLTYNTGSVNVKQINFAYRRGENGAWLIFKQLDKKQEGNLAPYQTEGLVFDDNTAPVGATLTDILYDNVPQTTECQEILSNQSLAYGNFYADYDLVQDINITTERNLTEFYEASNNTSFPLIGFNTSQRVLNETSSCVFKITSEEANFWYYEEGDVLTFCLRPYVFDTNTNTDLKKYYVNIPSFIFGIDSIYNRYKALFLYVYNDLISNYPEFENKLTYYQGNDFTRLQFNHFLGSEDTIPYVPTYIYDPIEFETKGYVSRSNKCRKSLKKGSKKVFGIQYYDRGNRSNTVQTTTEMILDVPLPGQEDLSSFQYNINEYGQSQSAYTVNPKFTINHTPPDWATHYSILVKKDELISSFMQTTITAIAQGSSINTLVFQLDKVPVQTAVDFYTAKYQGATFYHTPSKGDRVRFISGEYYKNPVPISSEDSSQIIPSTYVGQYKEVEVLEYNPDTNSIIVNEFDYIQIFGGSMLGYGTLCEIYTPKKDVAEDVWYEIEKFDIIDDGAFRYHSGNTQNQTADQPAIIESDYGDVYYRKRELATGVDFATFANYDDVVSDSLTKKKNVITWNNSNLEVGENNRGTYTFTTWYNRFFNSYFNRFETDVNLDVFPTYYDQYIFLPTMVSRFYFIEDFNYSDYYISDGHGRGRIGIENNKTKRTHYKTGVIHSAPYVMGSYINGLSSFDTLGNAEYLDDTFGPINRLKQVGYTLKCLQDRKEVSIYIQKSYATSGDGSGQLAYTTKTFGGINPSETLYGCIHPGSVLLIENDMYYYDYNSGTVVRSSSNGQYDLTGPKYKFNYYLTNKTMEIGKVETINILGELYQSKYEPIAFVDEQNTEYTLNFVKYFYPIDKPAQILGNRIYYQYDSNEAPVFDYLEDRWKTFVDYDLYWAETLGINVFTFKRDDLYEHNVAFLEDGTANELNFYGEQKTMSVEFVLNQNPILIKRPLSIGLRSNKLFDLTKVSTKGNASYPIMESKLYPNNFKLKEGYWWSAYLRDMTNIIASKPSQNTADKALINGRELRGYAVIHNIEYTGNEKAILFDVKCSYVPSEAMI